MEISFQGSTCKIEISDEFCVEHPVAFDVVVSTLDTNTTFHTATIGMCLLTEFSTARYMVKETTFQVPPLTEMLFRLFYHMQTMNPILTTERSTPIFLYQKEGTHNSIDVGFIMGSRNVAQMDTVAIEFLKRDVEPTQQNVQESEITHRLNVQANRGHVVLEDLPVSSSFWVRGKLNETSWSPWMFMHTVRPIDFGIQEIGDTFVRVQWHRPLWSTSRHIGSNVAAARVMIWEDPTPSLQRAARRWKIRKSFQPKELARRESSWENVADGECVSYLFDCLSSSSTYFVLFEYQNFHEGDWVVSQRLRLATSCPIMPALINRLTPNSVMITYSQSPPPHLSRCTLDVAYPKGSNIPSSLLKDLHHAPPATNTSFYASNTYQGSNVTPLPPGHTWTNVGKDKYLSYEFVEIKVVSTFSGQCTIRKYKWNAQPFTLEVDPEETYHVSIRFISPYENVPWSSPLVLTTPSHVEVRVVDRTTSSFIMSYNAKPNVVPPVYLLSSPQGVSHMAPLSEGNQNTYYYVEASVFESTDSKLICDGEEELFSDTDEEECVVTATVDGGDSSTESVKQREARLAYSNLDQEKSKKMLIPRHPLGSIFVPVKDFELPWNTYRIDVEDEEEGKLESFKMTQLQGEWFVENLDSDSIFKIVVYSEERQQRLYTCATYTLGKNWRILQSLRTPMPIVNYYDIHVSIKSLCEVYVILGWELVLRPPLTQYEKMVHEIYLKNEKPPRPYHMRIIGSQVSASQIQRDLYFVTKDNEITLRGLSASKSYTLQMRSITDQGNLGEWSSSSIKFEIPGLIVMELNSILMDHIGLRWYRKNFSENLEHKVLQYKLQVSNLSTFDDVITHKVPATSNSSKPSHYCIHYSSLKANSIFDINVAPMYANDDIGDFSNVVRVLVLYLPLQIEQYSENKIIVSLPDFGSLLATDCHPTSRREILFSEIRQLDENDHCVWKRSVDVRNKTLSTFEFSDLSPATKYNFGFTLIQELHCCDCYTSVQDAIGQMCCPYESTAFVVVTLPAHAPEVKCVGDDFVEFSLQLSHEPRSNPSHPSITVEFEVKNTLDHWSAVQRSYTSRDSGEIRHIFTGLSPNSHYAVRVRRTLSQGAWSTWSAPVTFQTLLFQKMELLDLGETFVHVAWKRPSLGEGVVQHTSRLVEISAKRVNTNDEEVEKSVTVDFASESAVVSGLTPHTVYNVRIRSHSHHENWGPWSPDWHVLTPTPFKIVIESRGETFAEIKWYRERRMLMGDQKNAIVASHESLTEVRIEVFNVKSEETFSVRSAKQINDVTTVEGLKDDTTYVLRMYPCYLLKGTLYESSHPTSVLYHTLPTANVQVLDIREDQVCLAWHRNITTTAMTPPQLSFLKDDTMNHHVPRVQSWELRIISNTGEWEDVYLDTVLTTIVVPDLLPDTVFSIFVRSIDDQGHLGAWSVPTRINTLPLLKLTLSKLSESFVYVTIERSEFANPDAEDTIMYQGEETKYQLYLLSFENVDHSLTLDVSTQQPSVKLDGLLANHQYGIIVRGINVYPQARRDPDDWGPWSSQTMFVTLPHTNLAVEHYGTDFAIVNWKHDLQHAEQYQITVHEGFKKNVIIKTQGTQLPLVLLNSHCRFALANVVPVFCAPATVIDYEIQIRHLGSSDTNDSCKSAHISVKEEFRTIVNQLSPNEDYDVTLRVCYSGNDVGTWLPPLRLRTEDHPECFVVSIQQTFAEFKVRTTNSDNCLHVREYDVSVNDIPTYQVLHLPPEGEFGKLKLTKLHRDSQHIVRIRELDRGHPCGTWCTLTTFYTLPSPPVPGELVEYVNGWITFTFGVPHKTTGKVIFGGEVSTDYIFSIESKPRALQQGTWKEVALTKCPQARFQLDQSQSITDIRFRVRLTKHFITEKDNITPVWGDYSEEFFWNSPSPPESPEHLHVARMNDVDALLEWDPPRNFEFQPGLRYHIYRDTSVMPETEAFPAEGTRFVFIGTTPKTQYLVTNLTPNTAYRFVVRCESNFGVGAKCHYVRLCTRIIPNEDEELMSRKPSLNASFNKRKKPHGIPALKDEPTMVRQEMSFLEEYAAKRKAREATIEKLKPISSKKGSLKPLAQKSVGTQKVVTAAMKWIVRRRLGEEGSSNDSPSPPSSVPITRGNSSKKMLQSQKSILSVVSAKTQSVPSSPVWPHRIPTSVRNSGSDVLPPLENREDRVRRLLHVPSCLSNDDDGTHLKKNV
eukprot:PhF_6_TR27941/c2_g1_i1/m.23